MYRHELKYIVNDGAAHILRSRLKTICKSDDNANENGKYRVTSLYFDDFCNSAVEDNLSGQFARKKFRIRVYNSSDSFIRLERKIKRDCGCRKDMALLTRDEYQKILAEDISFLADTRDPVLADFYISARTRLLRPKIIVDYMREAFVYDPGCVRITLDRRVMSSVRGMDLFCSDTLYAPAIPPSDVILEVKFTGFLPQHISDTLQHDCNIRQAVSKYTLGRLSAI